MGVRLRIVILCAGFMALAIAVRAARLQLVPHAKLAAMARRQYQAVPVMQARGQLRDRNQRLLVASANVKSFASHPQKIERLQQSAKMIGRCLHQKLISKLQTDRPFVWLKRHVTAKEQVCLERALHEIVARGESPLAFFFRHESARAYPHGLLARSLFGSLGIDGNGIDGLELALDQELKEHDVTLELDIVLQTMMEEALGRAHTAFAADGALAIAMDAQTGAILAIAQHDGSIRMRAITDGFEPGSTMKPLLALGALHEGFHLNDRFWGGNGAFRIGRHTVKEADGHAFGWITLERMLQVSSNIVAAKLALALGPDKARAIASRFGLGQKTGIDFPGEFGGKMPRQLKGLDLASFGFGYGLLVTPLQMLRAFASFANGGYLVEPHFQKKETKKERIWEEGAAQAMGRALSIGPDSTGILAAVDGLQIAGKTGTAQMLSDGHYSHDRHIASFIGFARDTRPVVLFVALSAPQGAYYASKTAAPLFHEIYEKIALSLGLHVAKQDAHK